MDNRVDISIIVLTYYHEDYLARAIDSALHQETSLKYEIIISDDASKDNTLQIAENYYLKYPDIVRVLKHDKNVGTTQNLYEAFMNSKGRYITLLAGDDYYCDNKKIDKQVEYLENNSECFAVATTIKAEYSDGEETGLFNPEERYRGRDFLQQDFAAGINYPIHGIMFRNKFDDTLIAQKFHIFVDFSRYIEDLTLCLLMFEFGKVHILPMIGYSVTTRRKDDENQHNFNSLYGGEDSTLMHVELMIKLQRYFGSKINLNGRLAEPAWTVLGWAIKKRNTGYLKYLKGIRFSCLILGACKWMNKKIRR